MDTHNIIEVDARELVPASTELRVAPQQEADRSLMASIAAHGLLQPIIVMDSENGYEVLDGRRRVEAVIANVDAGVRNDTTIPAVLLDSEADAGDEARLAANALREALHPADLAVAFARLHAKGWGEGAIGDRFGYGKRRVRQLLGLAGLSPEQTALAESLGVELDDDGDG